ncbi:hypothetical protein SAMN06265377_3741 [Flagellimonas pacifica]|uniref:Uncharacterized protein n=1 Tax=Flagellimonas pacifica TaxID=1247520 RepID=A0A285MXF4_9FLAO|nr:hypothetical protein SAMN06265377_3741 [Allomuricauda parva]
MFGNPQITNTVKTQITFLVLGLFMINSIEGQIKIGDNPQTLDPSSVLELESNSRVLVITRMTTVQMENTTPLRGAMVYNTDTECVHFYTGTLWTNLCDRPEEQTFTADPIVNFSPTMVITQDGSNFNFEVGEIRGENIVDTSINGAVDIQEGSITGLQLQEATVTFDKLADGENTGELLQWNGAEWILIDETGLVVTELDGVVGNEVTGPADSTLELSGTGVDTDPFLLDVSTGGITDNELATDAVTTDKILNGEVNTVDIADNAITNVKMADNAIGTTEIIDDSVNAAKINLDVAGTGLLQAADGSLEVDVTAFSGDGDITSPDGTITLGGTTTNSLFEDVSFDVADNAITNAKMANNAVTSAKIADGEIVDTDVSPTAAIAGTKIDPDFGTLNIATTGTLAAGNTTITGTVSTTGTATVGAYTLAATDGTNGQVLTTDGAGNASWQNTSPVAVQTTTAIDGDGLAATPLDLANNAVTSAKIADGEIVDADVSPTAAIAGTKIDPDFGTLNIATTGTLAAGNTTITGTVSTTGTATVGAYTLAATDGTNGQVLTTDGAGNASWQNTSPVAVQTTTAIDGDGLAATPLDLANNAVTSAKIADDAVTTAKIAPSATNGQVLTTVAGVTAWQSPAVVAMGKVDATAIAENANGATVAQNSTGNYTVTFDSVRPDAEYIVQLTVLDGGPDVSIEVTGTPTAASFIVQISQLSIGAGPTLISAPVDSEWYFTITDF